MSRYNDDEIRRAIDELRSGGEPVGEAVLGHFTEGQLLRYMAAVEAEEFANACRLRRSWLTGPKGLDPPGFAVFTYESIAPDSPQALLPDIPDFPADLFPDWPSV